MREYRFDVVRVVCMTYIVTYVHLYGYIYPQGRMTSFQPASIALAHACLGLFTFVSGYLLGKKYQFGGKEGSNIWTFYKKRILRVIPLFVLASIALCFIGLNGMRATINGLLCISPFVDPKPMTLYYIPIILWCYLLTPLVARHGLKWRVTCSLFLIAVLVAARLLFPSIDSRFVFNVFFYFVGIISASCFDWKFKTSYGTSLKTLAVSAFTLLVAFAMYRSLLYSSATQMAVGFLGVFAILFVCEGISHLLFDSPQPSRNGFRTVGCQLISIISYASMCSYMFHRFFYWAAETIWNPIDTSVKWLYMIVVVYPIILVLSYGIQKCYDNMVKNY